MNPASDFGVSATLALSEFAQPLHIPIEHRGVVQFAGKVSLDLKDQFRYSVEGRVKARGLAIREGSVEIENATLDSQVVVTPSGLVLRRLTATALGGQFAGSGELAGFRKLSLEGTIRNVSTAKALMASAQQPLPYAGAANGPIRLTGELGQAGLTQTVLKAAIVLTGDAPRTGQIPVDGLLNVTWNQAAGTIELHESRLSTRSSSLDLSGTLGQRLDVTAKTTRFEDIQVMLTEPLPIQLKNGSAGFQGSVIGPLENPRIEGHATLANFVYNGELVDSLTADFALTREGIDARTLTVAQGPIKVDGSGSVHLRDWKADGQSPLTAKLNVSGARIEKLLADIKQSGVPIEGAITVSANLHGSADALAGEAQINAENVTAWEEQIERIRATVKLTPDRIEVASGSALFHKSEVPFSGAFTHKPDEWKSGSVAFNVKTQALDLTEVRNVVKRWPQWKGALTSSISGSA